MQASRGHRGRAKKKLKQEGIPLCGPLDKALQEMALLEESHLHRAGGSGKS